MKPHYTDILSNKKLKIIFGADHEERSYPLVKIENNTFMLKEQANYKSLYIALGDWIKSSYEMKDEDYRELIKSFQKQLLKISNQSKINSKSLTKIYKNNIEDKDSEIENDNLQKNESFLSFNCIESSVIDNCEPISPFEPFKMVLIFLYT